MTKITERHYEAALALANSVRRHLKMKPVKRLRKGIPGDPECCVIARTINAAVAVAPTNRGYITVTDINEDEVFAKERGMANTFAIAFDKRQIPELIG